MFILVSALIVGGAWDGMLMPTVPSKPTEESPPQRPEEQLVWIPDAPEVFQPLASVLTRSPPFLLLFDDVQERTMTVS